jgi:hypothetical protein
LNSLRETIALQKAPLRTSNFESVKPLRLTPSFEQFKAIIADVRAQVFNADAQDSADFLEFLGLGRTRTILSRDAKPTKSTLQRSRRVEATCRGSTV